MKSERESLWSFLDDDALTIPGVISTKHPEGKDYVIASPDAETGMQLNALGDIGTKLAAGAEVSASDVARLRLDDAQEMNLGRQVLGETMAEMMEDGVSWVRIQRVIQYAFTHFAISPEAARKGAEQGLFSGKAPALNRAQRRQKTKTAPTPEARPGSAATKKPRPRKAG